MPLTAEGRKKIGDTIRAWKAAHPEEARRHAAMGGKGNRGKKQSGIALIATRESSKKARITNQQKTWLYRQLCEWLVPLGFIQEYQIQDFSVDFANPLTKVVVECDSNSAHRWVNQKQHDTNRNRALKALGWRVIRVRGGCTSMPVVSDGPKGQLNDQ